MLLLLLCGLLGYALGVLTAVVGAGWLLEAENRHRERFPHGVPPRDYHKTR